jgi:putative ABC transport system substrate-binding protein
MGPTRLTALVILALTLLGMPLATHAQSVEKVYRIGYLGNHPITAQTAHLWEAFVEALRELGYMEGKNIVIERRYSEGKAEKLPALAAELLRLRVDAIIAGDAPAAHAAKAATTTTPMVFFAVANPVETGLVASLRKPGRNITGLSASASSGSRSASSSMDPFRSAKSTVTCLRSPSRALFEVRIFSARCLGV